MEKPRLIKGGSFKDERGKIVFCNDFDMQQIKRFYYTSPSENNPIRAWQGHKNESKWFHCIKGNFEIKVIEPDVWIDPSMHSKVYNFDLAENSGDVLFIPGGFINGFKAKKPDSVLMIFSDCSLEESNKDDIRFDINKWQF